MVINILILSVMTVIVQGSTVDIVYTGSSWNSGSDTVQQARCNITIPQQTNVGQLTVNFTFSGPITGFNDFNNMNADSSGASWVTRTNKHTYGSQNLDYQFQVQWTTTARPTGTCVVTFDYAFTSTTTSSTTGSPSTTQLTSTTSSPATSSTVSTTTPSTTSSTISTTTLPPTTLSTTSTASTTSQTTTTSSSNTVDVEYTGGSWISGSDTIQQARCYIVVPQQTGVGQMTVNITFSGTITSFNDFNNMNAVSSGSSWAARTNKHEYGSQTLDYQFQVHWDTTNRPTGSCVTAFSYTSSSTTTSTSSATSGPTSTTSSTQSSSLSQTTSSSVTTTAGSSTFTTSDYSLVLNMSSYFYLAQRSGDLPDSRIDYRFDSALGDQGTNGEDLTGGYYDAGDHVKFNFPMASSMTVLAYSLYRFEDGYNTYNLSDEMRETIKWGLDYLLKCWNASSLTYYTQVGNGIADHAYWGRPENMTMARPAYQINTSSPGSDVAGETAAAFAAGYLVFNQTNSTYANTLLSAAETIYSFADSYRARYSDSITDVRAFYTSHNGFKDELALGAAMLYLATGNNTYNTKAQSFDLATTGIWAFSWDDKTVLAHLILYDITGNTSNKNPVTDFLNIYKYPPTNNDMTFIDNLVPYRDYWAPLRYTANAAFIALLAAKSGIDATNNTNWARSQIDYLLGNNDNSFSYVIGFGSNYPQRPHHRASSCPDLPLSCGNTYKDTSNANPQILEGALVGGPDSSGNYADDRNNFQQSEVACDYNAGFSGALAGLLDML